MVVVIAISLIATASSTIAQTTTLAFTRDTALGGVYVPGEALNVSVTVSRIGSDTPSSVALQEVIPIDWTFGGIVESDVAFILEPLPEQNDVLEFAWAADDFPVNFTYSLNVAPESMGDTAIMGQVLYRLNMMNEMSMDVTTELGEFGTPIIQPIADAAAFPGAPYVSPMPVLAMGATEATWNLMSGPDGATIDMDTGIVTWDAPTVVGSPHFFTLQAVNASGDDTESWMLFVVEANAALAIEGRTTLSLEQEFDFQVVLDSPDHPISDVAAFVSVDPALFNIVAVTDAEQFEILTQLNGDSATGQANFAASTAVPLVGNATIATVRLAPTALTDSTTIELSNADPRVSTAELFGLTLLDELAGLDVTILEADTTPPELTLNGGDVSVNCDEEFVDPGATATDDRDGDLTDAIVVTGEVDTMTPGDYTLTYSVTDGGGNESTAMRMVTVLDNCVSEGTSEGDGEGASEGDGEGTTEGGTEGGGEGVAEGMPEGSGEGLSEGTTEGSTEGSNEGATEGMTEGSAEGTTEGSGDGSGEGNGDGPTGCSAGAPLASSSTGSFLIYIVALLVLAGSSRGARRRAGL